VANTVGIMSDDDAAPDASSPDTEPIVTGAPRRRWKVPVVGLTAVALLTVATMVPFVLNDHRSFESYSVKTSSASVERWWADNHGEVEALQTAISDVQHALTIVDAAAVSAGCQRMHDAAELKLKASLPTPQADLTTDVAGAIEDAHSAAHMCLAALATTMQASSAPRWNRPKGNCARHRISSTNCSPHDDRDDDPHAAIN
jgi:hypothetical protein